LTCPVTGLKPSVLPPMMDACPNIPEVEDVDWASDAMLAMEDDADAAFDFWY